MSKEFDVDDDIFEKSLANIVDETTADARAYLNHQNRKKNTTNKNNTTKKKSSKKNTTKAVIIILSVVLVIAIIGLVTYFSLKSFIAKSKDNYKNYNELGYESYKDGDYYGAITNFEKALTYEEGQRGDASNINMMLYLFEAYKNTQQDGKQEAILRKIIEFDNENENAYYNLISFYDDKSQYAKIKELYEFVVENKYTDLNRLFNKYKVANAIITPGGGTFNKDTEVSLLCDAENTNIYYSLGDTDPKTSPILYTEPITLTGGATTIRFYTVNEYGFESDVVTESYSITYNAPSNPKFVPNDVSITQSEPVRVMINGVLDGCNIYYTLDGTTPTEYSKKYTDADPIILPDGTTTVTVLVVNSYGLTSLGTHTYNVKYVSAFTEQKAKEEIWKILIANEIVDADHHETSEGLLCNLTYYSKKLLNDKTIYMFYFSANGINYDYYFGADADTGDVYRITSSGTSYELEQLHNN